MYAIINKPLKYSSGVILLELMIASALGLLMVSALLSMYISRQNSHRWIQSITQIQDNAKTVAHLLSSEIHQAGYIGCAKLTKDFSVFSSRYPLTIENKLSGSRYDFIVRHAALEHVELLYMSNNALMLAVNDKIHFNKNNLLIISDCEHAEIFQIDNIIYSQGIQKIFPLLPLHHHYLKYAEVARFEINHFFVAATKHNDANGQPISALYVKSLYDKPIRLVDGIKSIAIDYVMNQSVLAAIRINMTINALHVDKIWQIYVSL